MGEMNFVAMTIINPWKEIGRAKDPTYDPIFSNPVGYETELTI